jgi:hypothetical protein
VSCEKVEQDVPGGLAEQIVPEELRALPSGANDAADLLWRHLTFLAARLWHLGIRCLGRQIICDMA